jgi:hypothetical protein
MGRALEIISGLVTAPGATLTALTMAAGNSATVRNAALSSQVALLDTWAFNNAAGVWRIRSPKLHDNVQGNRYRIPAASPNSLVVPGLWQRLVPQDNLTLELSGSAVGGQIEQAQLLIYYSDLPGAQARLIGTQELMGRTVNMWTTEIDITPGAAGGFSGQVAINSTFDQFKANTDYALVGYNVDTVCGAVRFTGPDFANLGVGGPGPLVSRWPTDRYFYWLTKEVGINLIPVFNSANKFGTLVDVVQNQAAAAVKVVAYLHELSMPNGANPQPMLT